MVIKMGRDVVRTSPFCAAKGGRVERSEPQGVHTASRAVEIWGSAKPPSIPPWASRGRDPVFPLVDVVFPLDHQWGEFRFPPWASMGRDPVFPLVDVVSPLDIEWE